MDGPGQDVELGIGLGVLSQLFQSRLSAVLSPLDATYTQLSLLSHLSRHAEAATVGELATALQINQPGTTKVVRRLEEQGLVVVGGQADDRRRKLVAVTEQGRARLDELMTALAADADGWFDGWTEAELDAFNGQVWRLVHRLDGGPAL